MSAENIPVALSLLHERFPDRILGYLTNLNIDRLGENVVNAEIVARFGEVVTTRLTNRNIDIVGGNALSTGVIDRAEEAPWSAYMTIMDGITDAESERVAKVDSSYLYPTNTLVRFENGLSRDRFHHVIESALAGIPNPSMPRIRSGGPRELIAHNLAYADIATLGRIGTALLRIEYKKDMGRNLQGITQNTIQEITDSGLRSYLPTDLAERADGQEEALGPGTLLSSGRLSLVGGAAREALVPTRAELGTACEQGKEEELFAMLLLLQRRYGDMPDIEAKTRFIARSGSSIPVSSTTMGVALREQVEERTREYKESYKDRDWVKLAQDIWSLATGLGASEGIGAFARAVSTVTVACTISAGGMISDRRLLRSLQEHQS